MDNWRNVSCDAVCGHACPFLDVSKSERVRGLRPLDMEALPPYPRPPRLQVHRCTYVIVVSARMQLMPGRCTMGAVGFRDKPHQIGAPVVVKDMCARGSVPGSWGVRWRPVCRPAQKPRPYGRVWKLATTKTMKGPDAALRLPRLMGYSLSPPSVLHLDSTLILWRPSGERSLCG